MRAGRARLLLGLWSLPALVAQPGGLGGLLDFDGPPAAPPAAPAPGSPRPAPAPPPAPAPTPTLNPETAARIAALRRELEEHRDLTLATIEPLPTLAACRELAARYRRAVDRTSRQPFLSGLRPAPELVRQVGALQARWGDLARAIRAGDLPPTIAGDRLRALIGDGAEGNVPVSGRHWAALSDAYFGEVLQAERLGADFSRQVRNSPAMRALESAMAHAEQALQRVEGLDEGDSVLPRRVITWDLHRVWRLGVELQIRRLESEGSAEAAPASLRSFLQDMDAARGLRHRSLALAPAGGEPAATLRVPVSGRIQARLGEADVAADIGAATESALPRLAEELYHTHFTLLQAEAFARQDAEEERRTLEALPPGPAREARRAALESSVKQQAEERRRTYEGRRLQLRSEIETEAERVRARR